MSNNTLYPNQSDFLFERLYEIEKPNEGLKTFSVTDLRFIFDPLYLSVVLNCSVFKRSTFRKLTPALKKSNCCFPNMTLQKGFNSGAGLVNLEYRARLLGGEFRIESTIGKGTKAYLLIPKISL